MSKIYAIVGLDGDGNIDTAGGFESKSDAWAYFLNNNLATRFSKAVVLPIQVKEKSDEVTEVGGQVRPAGKSVAAAV